MGQQNNCQNFSAIQNQKKTISQIHTFLQEWYSWECWTVTFIYYYSILHNHVSPYCPQTTYLWHSLCSPYKRSKTGVKLHPYWPDWVKNSELCHCTARAWTAFSPNSAHLNSTLVLHEHPKTLTGTGQVSWIFLQRWFFAFWVLLSHSASSTNGSSVRNEIFQGVLVIAFKSDVVQHCLCLCFKY